MSIYFSNTNSSPWLKSGAFFVIFGKKNPCAVKLLKTSFLNDYPKCGKNYPNFSKINPLFKKDIKSGKEIWSIFSSCFSFVRWHSKKNPKFGKENPNLGKNYPNAAKPFKMERDGTILKAVKKIQFIMQSIFQIFSYPFSR